MEATQLDNEINYLEQNKINIGNLKKNHKEFIKNNKTNITNTAKISMWKA